MIQSVILFEKNINQFDIKS